MRYVKTALAAILLAVLQSIVAAAGFMLAITADSQGSFISIAAAVVYTVLYTAAIVLLAAKKPSAASASFFFILIAVTVAGIIMTAAPESDMIWGAFPLAYSVYGPMPALYPIGSIRLLISLYLTPIPVLLFYIALAALTVFKTVKKHNDNKKVEP